MLKVTDANRKWWILIAMGAVAGLIMLDETVVGVALPTVRRDLGMSDLAAHWVINAYMLVFAGAAAAGGKMGDVFGFRNLLTVGVALFGVASLAAGFAENGASLVAARAVQGVGAAIIFPATVAMVTIAFPKEQSGMAIGALAAIGTMLLAVGPLVGGFLTEILSWRWIFWINAPIVMLIALIVLAAWVEPRKETRPKFDYGGTLALVAGLSMLVFAAMQGATWGWTQGIILGLLVAGAAALVLFVLIESRSAEPLIEVDLFRNLSFSACNLVLVVGQFSKITIVVFGALYFQDKLGMSPLVAGLALLVAVVTFPIMSVPVGWLSDKFSARWLVLGGLGPATLGMFWIGLATAWDSYPLLLPGLVVWGSAMPFCYAPAWRAMANAIPTEKQGQAGGIGVTARLLGGTVGMAVCSTLLVVTGDYRTVFLATAGIMAATFVQGWFAIAEPKTKRAPQTTGR